MLRRRFGEEAAFGKAQVEAGADAVCLGDHATRDLCSPLAYRDFLLNIHRELVERIPCPLILHICGDTSDRIPYIRETGVACFHFDSKVASETARELAGERLALMGGRSNFAVIRQGMAEEIQRDVYEKLAPGIDILRPECAVPLDAPYRSLQRLAEAARRRGKPCTRWQGFQPFMHTADTSTRASRGRRATWTVSRAGRAWPKNSP